MATEVFNPMRETFTETDFILYEEQADSVTNLVYTGDCSESTQEVEVKKEIPITKVASTSSGRRLKLYSWVYPYFGLYYCLRHPILIGPSLFLPVTKTAISLSLLYPILNTGFQKQSSFLRGYLATTRYQKYSWLIIGGLWIFQKTWLNFFVYDRVIKFFARGLLIKVYNVVSNNFDTISINSSSSDLASDKSKISHIRVKTVSMISAPEGEVPKIKARPFSKKVSELFYYSVNFFMPKSKWGLASFFWGRLLPGWFKLALPPGFGSIAYSISAGPTRAAKILQPFLKESFPGGHSERQAWLKEFSLPVRCLGISAAFLESIPMVGPLFAFTNTVGAGIWLATYHPPSCSNDSEDKSVF